MKTFKLLSGAVMAAAFVSAGFGAGSLFQAPGGVAQAQSAPQVQVAPQVQAAATAAPVPVSQAVPVSSGLAAFESTFEQIYAQVNPSVVNIQVVEQAAATTARRSRNGSPFGFPQAAPQQALGSGFVWDTQGDIVTNNHVVNGASSILVTFADGTTASAKVVGNDPNADLAVIRVSVPASELQPVQVADSTQAQVGQIAIAIGNPFGLSGTMTEGIVSGLARTIPSDNASNTGGTYLIPDIIQTDAAINPGNSGGVLVDDQGRLLGVTAAMESSTNSSSGVGFVIPSAIVRQVVPGLIANGKYDHAWLGLSGTTLTPDLAQAMNLPATQKGVLVESVVDGGPAAAAGLKTSDQPATVSGQPITIGGDVLTAVNGQPLNRFEDLMSYLLTQTKPGQTVALTVLRGGKTQTVNLTLGTMPTN